MQVINTIISEFVFYLHHYNWPSLVDLEIIEFLHGTGHIALRMVHLVGIK
jgi:hypothetical protein